MNTPFNTPATGQTSPPAPTSSNSKPLWAAVGILGVAVLAMGGTMIYQGRPTAPEAPVAAAVAPVNGTQLALNSPAGSAADDLAEKPAAAPAKPAPAPVKKVVQAPKPAAPLTYSNANGGPAYNSAPAQQVCASCGTVESVTPVQRSTKAEGPGVGAVAGGVLGAVLGNQVGSGSGRAAATVLGAVGGGFAGNAIEGNMKKVTVYQVGVRMEDGSRRNVEISQAPNIGSRVTVEGSNLRYR
jgi:outer membrane lipoprotein SlyB